MTTLSKEKVRCAVCGKRLEIMVLGSTNQFGSPDLDLRPPEMARSTISFWVYRCPDCGYCASRLDEGDPKSREYLRGPEYQSQLADSEAPRLAVSFLCKSMLDERKGDLAEAAWALIHAAWACDDADNEVKSRECRTRAAAMLQRAEAKGKAIYRQPEEGWAVLVDLLRRAGRFTEARKVAESKLAKVAAGPVRQVLDFQLELILRQDTRRHTLDEAPSPEGKRVGAMGVGFPATGDGGW